MTLDHVDATHQSAVGIGTHFDDFTGAAFVAAVQDDDLIAFADLGSHYSTSGASERIFMWFLRRSSRGISPMAA